MVKKSQQDKKQCKKLQPSTVPDHIRGRESRRAYKLRGRYYPLDFRLRVVAAAHRAQLVEGATLASVYKPFGIDNRLLHKWLKRAPQWLRTRQRAQAREKKRQVKRFSGEARRRRLQRAWTMLREGFTIGEVANKLSVSKAQLATWLWESPIEELVRQARAPSMLNVRKPPKVERPRAPRRDPLTLRMLESPPEELTHDWLKALYDTPVQRQVKTTFARLSQGVTLGPTQKMLVEKAAQLDAIADRVLERIDRLMVMELAGYEGADAALYDWEWFYVTIARETRTLLTAAGVVEDVAPAETAVGKRAGQVVIPNEF